MIVHQIFIFLVFLNLSTASSQNVIDCDEIRNISQGLSDHLESLAFPNPQKKRRVCVFLNGDEKHRVTLIFLDNFYLFRPTLMEINRSPKSCGDYTLRIFDGPDNTHPQIGEYCDGTIPLPVMSSGPHLFLQYTSRESDSYSTGYLAEYEFVSDFGIKSGIQKVTGVCEFMYNSNDQLSGTITSPNPNGTYPASTNCTYLFKGNYFQRVHFKFQLFDLEGIEPCDARSGSDFLEFSDTLYDDLCPARRCGIFAPQEVISKNEIFRIVFRSNERLSGRGFRANFTFVGYKEIPAWASPRTSNNGNKMKPTVLTGLILPLSLMLHFVFCAFMGSINGRSL